MRACEPDCGNHSGSSNLKVGHKSGAGVRLLNASVISSHTLVSEAPIIYVHLWASLFQVSCNMAAIA